MRGAEREVQKVEYAFKMLQDAGVELIDHSELFNNEEADEEEKSYEGI